MVICAITEICHNPENYYWANAIHPTFRVHEIIIIKKYRLNKIKFYSICILIFIFQLFILFYFILFYFILFYFILFYFILFYFILFYFILFYFILFNLYFNISISTIYFILFYFI